MIKILHLISGETLIGDVKNDTDISATYIIEQPFMMDIIDDSDEGSGVRMDYLLAFSKDNGVHIKKNVVLYDYNPSDRMERYYNKLVEYTVKHENDKILEQTLEGMEEMDRKMKSFIAQRLVGKSTVN
jgi:hypothetical protein